MNTQPNSSLFEPHATQGYENTSQVLFGIQIHKICNFFFLFIKNANQIKLFGKYAENNFFKIDKSGLYNERSWILILLKNNLKNIQFFLCWTWLQKDNKPWSKKFVSHEYVYRRQILKGMSCQFKAIFFEFSKKNHIDIMFIDLWIFHVFHFKESKIECSWAWYS